MKKIILIFMMLIPNLALADGDNIKNLDLIRALLIKNREVQGDFKQVRKVIDPKLVLESAGQFNFKLPLELHWNQNTPFKLDLEMTPEKIVQKNSDGSIQTMTAKEQPVVFMFSSSFLGIFSGDSALIEKNFSYQAKVIGKNWTLDLEPKDSLFKKVISKVQIKGSDFVNEVVVSEKTGNTTQMIFNKMKRVH